MLSTCQEKTALFLGQWHTQGTARMVAAKLDGVEVCLVDDVICEAIHNSFLEGKMQEQIARESYTQPEGWTYTKNVECLPSSYHSFTVQRL